MRICGLESIGWTLLNSFWQFGLLVLVYLCITAGGTRLTAAVRHNIAAGLSFFGTVWFFSALLTESATITAFTRVVPIAVQPVPLLTLTNVNQWLDRIVSLLPWMYAAVLILRTGYALQAIMNRPKRINEALMPAALGQWQYFLEKCRMTWEIRRSVLLKWTCGPGMARTYGFLRPVILIPIALINRLTSEQVEAILIHELAHIRRYDYLTHLAMSLFRFIFYFNPFARFLFDVVSREREQACDDLVLGHCCSATAYAQALMTLEQFRQQPGLMMSATGQRPGHLADRIRRIAGVPLSPVSHRALIRLSIAIILCAFTLYYFRLSPVVSHTHAREKVAEKLILPAGPGDLQPSKISAVPKQKIALLNVSLPPRTDIINSHSPDKTEAATIDTVNAAATEMAALQGMENSISADSSLFDRFKASSAPEIEMQQADEDVNTLDYAADKVTRSFSYRNEESAPSSVNPPQIGQPYIPPTSFEYRLTDSVPAIALQSLQENKAAVISLLGKWKALQMQQSISQSLELQYRQLKLQADKDIKSFPAKKAALKRSLDQLKEQMQKRKAKIDRLSTVLAEEPVIYI